VKLILTNYGHRYIQHQSRSQTAQEIEQDPLKLTLAQLLKHTIRPVEEVPSSRQLIARGLVQEAEPGMDRNSAKLRYARNPLENIRRVVFEYTTICNLSCHHCRNSHVEPAFAKEPDRLKRVVDISVPLGLRWFDFIGGEVSLYGRGWLDVVGHIASYPDTLSGVITSGWFLGESDFKAAGRRYADDEEYLTHLRKSGLTHIIFSLDGPEHIHDRWRGVPGLYRRIMAGIPRVRAAGLMPRVSLVISPEVQQPALDEWLVRVANAIYDFSLETRPDQRIRRLHSDPFNYISYFIDVGNAVTLVEGAHSIYAFSDDVLRCKNLYRPSPSLRIQANGEVSLCPLMDVGEGYGNVHERDPIDVFNEMQDAFVYKLHAEKRIGEYRRYLDTSVFGDRFEHVCSLRAVLTMLAKAMDERGISASDASAIQELNLEVARKTGHLPSLSQKRAIGHNRPK